ncbi:4-(cytidine 5'-diphospho)-2-C-methyl-D-erythritol kinase [Sphingobacterium sp. lm-10]|uniref:4-(cytidine 5'-diphospho)-2-C-methyl-D-erythritol kinase n=1 Tax=Sphingobacterium sp. lm-10 TaxID=2944904 RepID=UPI00202152EE|nr:4-(cytidine 5'-diphospho)-2-C-methyl-D-erythritol kinase [Sphingobacterium sp. lm-10]MCL7987166.1 4-(cytidine 5'-diphospho)-2-C-methyl-D-erythritol kinase [Sphingobacterium sp. lm-10]
MLQFANAKINIGLHITGKRPDGYHDLESIFYPVKLYDGVEILPSGTLSMRVYNYAFPLNEDNLCTKAYQLLAADYDLPTVQIHLLKGIPVGAGLGGGSADASRVLMMLNEQYKLDLTQQQLESYASQLGADCPFFIRNTPIYATGIGTTFEEIALDLSPYHIVVVKPPVHISTAEAYQSVSIRTAQVDLREAMQLPLQEWKYHIKNDFEEGLFRSHPQIQVLKAALYDSGAIYASMSGSGSAVYALFNEAPDLQLFQSFGTVFSG